MTLLRPAIVLLAVFTLLLGGIYPLFVTGVARGVFVHKANGSVIEKEGKVVGSALLGQEFSHPKYFWGRLSAAIPAYNAAASAGSNVSPANPKLAENVAARIAALKKADSTNKNSIPMDLVTASASGLDPDISPAAAQYQARRVAKARHMEPEEVQELIQAHTAPRFLGFIGEPRVNVLMLNRALDEKK